MASNYYVSGDPQDVFSDSKTEKELDDFVQKLVQSREQRQKEQKEQIEQKWMKARQALDMNMDWDALKRKDCPYQIRAYLRKETSRDMFSELNIPLEVCFCYHCGVSDYAQGREPNAEELLRKKQITKCMERGEQYVVGQFLGNKVVQNILNLQKEFPVEKQGIVFTKK